MEFLQAIEQLGAVRLLKASFFAYPVVNALHIAAIGALFTCVLLMDLAVLGRIRSLPREKFIALLRRAALVAFAVAALTGLTLFSIQAATYARNPVFLLKLGLIVTGRAQLPRLLNAQPKAVGPKTHPRLTRVRRRIDPALERRAPCAAASSASSDPAVLLRRNRRVSPGFAASSRVRTPSAPCAYGR